MLKLKKRATGPEWADLLGARFLFAPIGRSMARRARVAAAKAVETFRGKVSDAEFGEMLGDAYSEELLVAGILDWEGVGDEAGENLLPCTDENKRLLLADPAYFDPLDAHYVLPFAIRVAEGNALRASPNGTGAAAKRARATAGSSAKRKAKTGAKAAPIASTPARPPRARKHGRSSPPAKGS
jgi:hypothetical protein